MRGTIDDKVNADKAKLMDKIAIDFGFVSDKYYSAKDKMGAKGKGITVGGFMTN